VTATLPLVLEREIFAPAEDLLRAFAEPERLRDWFHPVAGLAPDAVRLDVRPDGAFTLALELPLGERLRFDVRYHEIGGERVVFHLARHDGNGRAGAPMRVTVTAAPGAGATRLRLHHEGVADDERAMYAQSWEHAFRRLVGGCPEHLERYYARLQAFPRHRSRFGGLWPDLSNAAELVAGKEALGILDAADAARFRHWIEHGYVVLEGAIEPVLVERLRAELDRAWEHGDERVVVERFEADRRVLSHLAPGLRDRPHKVLDYHAVSPAAREAQFAPAIRRFLGQLFERPPLAFQSLVFRWGSEQDMHQDTAFVVLRSPMELVGCWIALEDVAPGSGELQYYAGSHRIPEYLWFGRGRARPNEYDDLADFLRHVRAESERLGCELRRFHPRKGDVLLWHADLVHGGARRALPDVTRKSFVTHFCPVDVDPEWLGEMPSSPRLEHAPGCFYCHPLR
jgi:ectoine hydroxylase-related dioxygenase (phytanoyl-CoA dioxygenase family)/uncharacterized protein YndB with AHSA1/START domain